MRYLIRSIGTKTDSQTIVFETFSGRSYSDSPKAIYEYMQANQDFEDYSFIWVFKEPERYKTLADNRNTYLVKYDSKEYEKALAKAKYWIFNYRALDHFIPREDQIYIQCWHGTPLKRLGYDITKSDNVMNSLEEIRDKYYRDALRFKYLVSPCTFASEKFKSAWNLSGIGKEDCILECGYPRNDFLINYDESDVRKIKRSLGLEENDKKLVMYAPTWRDDQHADGIGYTYEQQIDFDYLQEQLGDEYIVLFRAHYLIASSFDFSRYEGFVYDVSNVDDINELYIVSDMLITDYSSVFFDFAILLKPIIFYMYDLEKYKDDLRGFYMQMNELPGKVVQDKEALVNMIKNIRFDDTVMNNFNHKFNYLNDGKSSERLVREVFYQQ